MTNNDKAIERLEGAIQWVNGIYVSEKKHLQFLFDECQPDVFIEDQVHQVAKIETTIDALQALIEHYKGGGQSYINWQTGFPDENCMCLVELKDGEHVVTPYTHTAGTDTWGDKRKTGWSCLSGSHCRVVKWVKTKDFNTRTTALDKLLEQSNDQ